MYECSLRPPSSRLAVFDPAVLSRPGTCLLDASRPSPEHARSLCFSDPLDVLVATDGDDVLQLLSDLDAARSNGRCVAGCLAYEAGGPLMDLPSRPLPNDEPLAWFGIYDAPTPVNASDVQQALDALSETASVETVRFDRSRTAYRAAIRRIHDHIRAGNVYQINYTAPLRFRWQGDPRVLYRHGRRRQRVPYGAYVHRGTDRVLSWSPELFFHQSGRRIVTRPMKGTIRRGHTPDEDRRLRDALASDPKNRAENLMIVDLLRNDLSRCCTPGSVRVPHLFTTEPYETVTQMTSTVEGTLRADVGLADVLHALFPCGSITGAPKHRAMQIIEDLEPTPRGVYCGAIGYAGPTDATFNVAIRTARLPPDGTGTMGVGSGIVWDSTADDEYDECQLKGQFLCTPNATSA